MTAHDDSLPLVLAGPMLRRVRARDVALWLATSVEARVRVELELADGRVAWVFSGTIRLNVDESELDVVTP